MSKRRRQRRLTERLSARREAFFDWWLDGFDSLRSHGRHLGRRLRHVAGPAAVRDWCADVLDRLRVRRGLLAAAAGVLVVGAALVVVPRWLDGHAPADAGHREPSAGPPRQIHRRSVPGIDSVGIHLSVSPDRFGDLDVVERIITPQPITVLPLSGPPLREGGVPAGRLVDLQVTAGGYTVGVPWSGAIEDERELELPRPATRLELHYRVDDAAATSEAAPPGRATLSLRPAAAGALASSPTVVAVRGAVVHNLVCLDAPRERQLCGVGGRGGWHTRPVTAATSHVLALVDLPG